MVASLRLSFPRMEAASSHCLRLVGYSLPVSECLTLELVMRMTRLGSARGTGVASRDLSQKRMNMQNFHCFWKHYFYWNMRSGTKKNTMMAEDPVLSLIYSHYLQSISKACPSLPRTDTNWSIMPHGTPAWVCSACWQATALDILSPSSVEKKTCVGVGTKNTSSRWVVMAVEVQCQSFIHIRMLRLSACWHHFCFLSSFNHQNHWILFYNVEKGGSDMWKDIWHVKQKQELVKRKSTAQRRWPKSHDLDLGDNADTDLMTLDWPQQTEIWNEKCLLQYSSVQ